MFAKRVSSARLKSPLSLFLGLAFILNLVFWFGTRDIYARWTGVPPVPDVAGARIMSLGDMQFSYRLGGMTLQNLGDTGGQTTPLKDYDYARLGQWFRLLHGLDPASNHVPMTAAYYFGGTAVPRDVAVVVDYLSRIGRNPAGSKWRWLAHAVFLARHRMNDLPLALDLSYELARMQPVGDTLPAWARQMPATILRDQGKDADARAIIENLMTSEIPFHPNEVNFMRSFLVEQLGVDAAEVEQVDRIRQERGLDALRAGGPRLPAPMPD